VTRLRDEVVAVALSLYYGVGWAGCEAKTHRSARRFGLDRRKRRIGWLGLLGRSQEIIILMNFKWNFDFGKTFEFCTRRFRWNLDMGFFLKSSRLSKDLENEICHAMICNLNKIILEKDFICKVDLTCNLYALF
jgi:hypothetical protein